MKERYIREVVSSFPYPIAKNFVKLRTDECLESGPMRLKYILATGEAISRFLGMVILCQVRRHLEESGQAPPRSLSADFRQRFSKPTWGTWIHFAREGLKFLTEAGAPLLLEELPSFFARGKGGEISGGETLELLLTVRNALNHEHIKAMRPHEFEQLCDETFPKLEQALEGLEFLLDYDLTFFSRIEVHKRRLKAAKFVHRYKRIAGISDDFYGGREKLDFYMDSDSLILMRNSDRAHLSLTPFYVYEEKAGKAPDVFYYNGLAGATRAVYSACAQGGSFESPDSLRGDEYREDLDHVLVLVTSPEGKGEVAP